MAEITIRPADFSGGGDAALCRTLMREYATHLNAAVGGEHICLTGFEKELAGLPGAYAEPEGAVLLVFVKQEPAGCVALKPLHREDEKACEMKRLWVRPDYQRAGLGRHLAHGIIEAARVRSYTAMYLDTMPGSMPAAYALYCGLGFEPVEKYVHNPVLHDAEALQVVYLRREL